MSAVNRCDFHTGDCIDRKYHVETVLGEGSFGSVFKVKDASGNLYALKVLKLWAVPPEIRQKLTERFTMEFETGQIDSHYLVHSLSYGAINNIPYIVMEYCPQGNLLQAVEQNRPIDRVKTTKEILYGLRDLHRYGKVHRDLKPENVLIKANGTAALTDFGIAGDRNKRLTERRIFGSPGQIFGTYAYMPPEQVMAKREATVLPTTDIFSFGVMMYFLLTGQLPFGELKDENDLENYIRNSREGKWNHAVLKNHPQGKPFYPAIAGCLSPDFKKRLQTADEVLSLIPSGATEAVYRSAGGQTLPGEAKTGLLLRVMQGEEYRKVYKLNDLLEGNSRIITVGRNDGYTYNRIPLTENQSSCISRKHCTLELDYAGQNWYIRDGQWDRDSPQAWKRSLNGTFVNSSEVSFDGMAIGPGDIISMGDVKLRVEGY